MQNKPLNNKPDILSTSATYWLYATRPITGIVIFVFMVAGIITGDLHLIGTLVLGLLALLNIIGGSLGKNKARQDIEDLERQIRS